MEFRKGLIQGVKVQLLQKYLDERGWLSEVFRIDEISKEYHPVMGYTSVSLPKVVRGPHEHKFQSDLFVFLGPGNFKVLLWDNRESSDTYRNRMLFFAGQDRPTQVLIPPGVVHAYQNMSETASVVLNFPNQLFMGVNKKEEVDEIRHEDGLGNPFQIDF